MRRALDTRRAVAAAVWTLAALVLVVAAAVASASHAKARVGTLSGTIRYVGGPAPGTPGKPAPGSVSIRDAGGKLVKRVHVRAGHGFRISLAAGRYTAKARSGSAVCPANGKQVQIVVGRITHVSIHCTVE